MKVSKFAELVANNGCRDVPHSKNIGRSRDRTENIDATGAVAILTPSGHAALAVSPARSTTGSGPVVPVAREVAFENRSQPLTGAGESEFFIQRTHPGLPRGYSVLPICETGWGFSYEDPPNGLAPLARVCGLNRHSVARAPKDMASSSPCGPSRLCYL